MKRLVRGILAGTLATVPMTGVIATGRAARLLFTPPPVQITARVGDKAGITAQTSGPAFQASWLAAHFGFGAFLGGLYVLARPLLPGNTWIAGPLYGLLAWAANYLGAMPALGLYPWPKDDSRGRTAVMIAAHFVFGLATAVAARRLSRQQ
ncbi:MAG: DUF6789 family protein [Chloroflexota bacterium]